MASIVVVQIINTQRRKTMNRLLSVKNIIASMLLSFLMGCSVQVKNHTPLEFPLNIKNVLLGFEEFLYPESKQQFFELSENPAHRFFLEVKPKNVSIVHAYISINGTEYVMEGSEKGLWTYESPKDFMVIRVKHMVQILNHSMQMFQVLAI